MSLGAMSWSTCAVHGPRTLFHFSTCTSCAVATKPTVALDARVERKRQMRIERQRAQARVRWERSKLRLTAAEERVARMLRATLAHV